MKNIYISVGIVFAFVVGGLVGYAIHPTKVSNLAGSSPTGTTNSITRAAYIVWSPTTQGVSTSTSLLNGDANDRVIKTVDVACVGLGTTLSVNNAGLVNLIFIAATTSTSIPTALGNTNHVLDSSISTSSALMSYLSTSTPGIVASSDNNRIWLAGSYLTFTSNATTSAVCTVGVSYLTE